jgi:hypothetical protein
VRRCESTNKRFEEDQKETKQNKDLNKKGSAKPNKSFELLLSNNCSREISQPSGPNKSVKS